MVTRELQRTNCNENFQTCTGYQVNISTKFYRQSLIWSSDIDVQKCYARANLKEVMPVIVSIPEWTA